MADEMIRGHEFIEKKAIWYIEVVGQQQYIYSDMKERAKKKHPSIRVLDMAVKTTDGVKNDGIASLIDPMSNGEWYFHKGMTDAIKEIKDYPNGMYRDLLNIMGKANTEFFTRKVAEVRRVVKHYSEPPQRNPVTGY